MLTSAWSKLKASFSPWFVDNTSKHSEMPAHHLTGDDSMDYTDDVLMKLPTEVLECIFEYVPVIDGLVACHVSSLWNERLSLLHRYWKKWAKPYMDPRTLDTNPDWKSLCELVIGCLSRFPKFCLDTYSHEMIDFTPFSLGVEPLISDYHSGYLLFVGDLYGRQTVPQPHALIYKREDEDWILVCSFDMSPDEKMAQGCAMTKSKIVCTTDDGLVSFWSFDRSSNEVTKICERNDECQGPVLTLVASDDLELVLLLGTDKLNLWDLKTGSILQSFPDVQRNYNRKIDIITGDKSPFVGYNCIYVEEASEDHQTSMYVWGQNIHLENPLFIKIARDFERYADDPTTLHCLVPSDAFFEDGNLLYGLSNYSSSRQLELEGYKSLTWTKIVRHPLNPEDIVINGHANVSDEAIAIFRQSLRLGRKDSSVQLRNQFISTNFNHFYEMGRLFSVCDEFDSILALNATGDWDDIGADVGGFTPYFRQSCDLEWLHGLNNIKPGNAIDVIQAVKNDTVSLSWKRDVLKPLTLAELIAARNNREKGLLASLSHLRN